MRYQRAFLLAIAVLVSLVTGWLLLTGESRAGSDGGMDAMSIDMDPGGNPANTATSVGSREFCARINENDELDADEDSVDTLEFDLTTGPEGIPQTHPIIGFQAAIMLDDSQLAISKADPGLLLMTRPGGKLFDLSEMIPDPRDPGLFWVGAVDIGGTDASSVAESGPGVLARLAITSSQSAEAGTYDLRLDERESLHIDPTNTAWTPFRFDDAIVAIDEDCPNVQPSPRPSRTPGVPSTPQPSLPPSTPGPGVVTISAGSGTAAPGGTVRIPLLLSAAPPGIGAFVVDVTYDPSLASPVSCESTVGICNTAYDHETMRAVGASATGIAGDSVELAAFILQAGYEPGRFPLEVDVRQVTDDQANPIAYAPVDGGITVLADGSPTTQATPAPSASGAGVLIPPPSPPQAAGAPSGTTPTPAVLPAAGSGGGQDTQHPLPLIALVIVGAAAIAGAVYSTRRMR